MFLNSLWVVFYVEVDPHQPGNAEDVHKIDCDKYTQQAEGNGLAPAQKPVEKRDKEQAKPPRPDVGDEHRAVVIAGFGKIVEVALGASLEHVEGLFERPAPGFERFAIVAAGALEVKNTVTLGAFLEY